MTLFGGRSFFGMGSKRLGSARRNFESIVKQIEDVGEINVEATESAPGELVRRKQRESKRDWTERGLFKAGFNAGAPRLRGVKKFTK